MKFSWACLFLLALLVMPMLGGAAQAETNNGAIHGVPVLLDSVKRAGSPIADDFTVAKGSALLGTSFPSEFAGITAIDRRPIDDRGWSVELLVTGEPENVLQRYQAQGAAVGIPARADPAAACSTSIDHPDRLECGMYDSVAGYSSRRLGMYLRRETKSKRGGPVSILRLSYFDPEPTPPITSEVSNPAPEFSPPPGSSAGSTIPFPKSWPPLLSTGRRFASVGFGNSARALRVVQGSELVAPVVSLATSRFVAVMRVRGDVRAVVGEYAKQFSAAGFTGVQRERQDNGATVHFVDFGEIVDADHSIEAVVQKGKPTYLRVTSGLAED